MFSRMSPFTVLSTIVVSVVVLSSYYITPYIGAIVMNVFDGIFFGFRWLGINSPIVCAVVYGAFVGGCVGACYAMRRTGHTSAVRPTVVAAVVVTLTLVAAGGLYRATMKPNVPPAPVAAPPAALPVGTPSQPQ